MKLLKPINKKEVNLKIFMRILNQMLQSIISNKIRKEEKFNQKHQNVKGENVILNNQRLQTKVKNILNEGGKA